MIIRPENMLQNPERERRSTPCRPGFGSPAYTFARRLKALGGLAPFEAVCKAWTKEPHRFRLTPDHLTSGLNT